MKNYTIYMKRKNDDIELPDVSDVLEFLWEISGEDFASSFSKTIVAEKISWSDYKRHMYALCQKYNDIYFTILMFDLQSIMIQRETFINDLIAVDRPSIKFGDLNSLEFNEIDEHFKTLNTYDDVIDFEPILNALRNSDSDVDCALYHAIMEWKTHFKDISSDYFHKAFRQVDVTDSGHKDMIMWSLLNASKTFWKVLNEQ